MTQSFTTEPGLAASKPRRRRVLITGAAGRIGSNLAAGTHEKYDLRLMVRGDEKRIEQIRPYGEVVTADLGDLEALKIHCQGIDTVVHLAADPSPDATWQSVLPNNIIGTYHAFVAAKSAGCRRVIYASSIHAVSGYPADVQIKTSEAVNPGDLYGVSKCFGEALARYMAEQEGLSAIAIRIGAYQSPESARKWTSYRMLDAFISYTDLQQLIERCIDAEGIRFAIVHGVSNNRFKRLDISDARELLGYEPKDDLAAENPQLKDLHLSEEVGSHSQSDGTRSGIREDV